MIGHIVALGGGGFSMEPDNPLLDDFTLSLCRRKPARVCFIPTGSADSATYITKFIAHSPDVASPLISHFSFGSCLAGQP